jgi:hypothetical protein
MNWDLHSERKFLDSIIIINVKKMIKDIKTRVIVTLPLVAAFMSLLSNWNHSHFASNQVKSEKGQQYENNFKEITGEEDFKDSTKNTINVWEKNVCEIVKLLDPVVQNHIKDIFKEHEIQSTPNMFDVNGRPKWKSQQSQHANDQVREDLSIYSIARHVFVNEQYLFYQLLNKFKIPKRHCDPRTDESQKYLFNIAHDWINCVYNMYYNDLELPKPGEVEIQLKSMNEQDKQDKGHSAVATLGMMDIFDKQAAAPALPYPFSSTSTRTRTSTRTSSSSSSSSSSSQRQRQTHGDEANFDNEIDNEVVGMKRGHDQIAKTILGNTFNEPSHHRSELKSSMKNFIQKKSKTHTSSVEAMSSTKSCETKESQKSGLLYTSTTPPASFNIMEQVNAMSERNDQRNNTKRANKDRRNTLNNTLVTLQDEKKHLSTQYAVIGLGQQQQTFFIQQIKRCEERIAGINDELLK